MSELTIIPGVGNITAEKLQSAGVDNVDAVAEAAVELLVQLTGFYETRAAAIRDAARELARSSADAPQLELVPEPAEEEPATEAKAKASKAEKKKKKKVKAKKAAKVKATKAKKKKKAAKPKGEKKSKKKKAKKGKKAGKKSKKK